ncbi:hypothetical protein RJ641_016552 [Dillenia turbinata]|uniref:Uncharacterized protein n=1 Tax=Dillenia turbinata TaxID=194707 RepID=A0AAN8UM53_9MAGN
MGQAADIKSFHLVNWQVVQNTLQDGGLGIRDIKWQNRALLNKWIFSGAVELLVTSSGPVVLNPSKPDKVRFLGRYVPKSANSLADCLATQDVKGTDPISAGCDGADSWGVMEKCPMLKRKDCQVFYSSHVRKFLEECRAHLDMWTIIGQGSYFEVFMFMDCALAPVEDQRELVEKSKSIALREAFLQWSEWQLCDSIPPTGGFAYSFGLEAAVRTCIISDPEDLRICIVHVLNNTGSLLLPLVYSATVSEPFPLSDIESAVVHRAEYFLEFDPYRSNSGVKVVGAVTHPHEASVLPQSKKGFTTISMSFTEIVSISSSIKA